MEELSVDGQLSPLVPLGVYNPTPLFDPGLAIPMDETPFEEHGLPRGPTPIPSGSTDQRARGPVVVRSSCSRGFTLAGIDSTQK